MEAARAALACSTLGEPAENQEEQSEANETAYDSKASNDATAEGGSSAIRAIAGRGVSGEGVDDALGNTLSKRAATERKPARAEHLLDGVLFESTSRRVVLGRRRTAGNAERAGERVDDAGEVHGLVRPAERGICAAGALEVFAVPIRAAVARAEILRTRVGSAVELFYAVVE